jgi:hypothetical protein
MADRIPFADQKKPRAVMLSDLAWDSLYEDSILQGRSPNVICEALIKDYLARPLAGAPPTEIPPLPKKQHNLRLVDSLWKALRVRAHQENRPASAIVEQMLHEYYDLQAPPPELPA